MGNIAGTLIIALARSAPQAPFPNRGQHSAGALTPGIKIPGVIDIVEKRSSDVYHDWLRFPSCDSADILQTHIGLKVASIDWEEKLCRRMAA